MTIAELAALPVGSLVKLQHDDDGRWEIGEIIKQIHDETTVIWPESGVKQFIGHTAGWNAFVSYLEKEE